MTMKQRAQVWARKDELTKALKQLPATDQRSHDYVKEKIEQCNQALVQNNYELMPQTVDAEV